MQKFVFLMLGVLLGISAGAQSTGDKILGKWMNEDKSRIIEFIKNGSAYEAVIRKAENQSLVGKKQITSLKYKKGNAYNGGTLHIFQRNKKVNCSAKFESDTKLELKASIGLMSTTQVWIKVTS